jgi:hypothetical protein
MMARARPKRDEQREQLIRDEIVVDAHDAQERAMAWYHYLDETLEFPFTATCIVRRQISPLQVNDEVDVLEMADPNECQHEMFVMTRWEKDGLAVPLSQLKPINETDEQTRQAVADWHYWVKTGYEF